MYKYNLHTLLRKLSVEDYEVAMKWLPKMLHVAPKTFRSWIYIKKGSKQEITSNHLFKLASFFECSIEDLFNRDKSVCLTFKKLFENER